MNARNDYEVVSVKDGSVRLAGAVVSQIMRYRFVEGLCAADSENSKRPRDRAWYRENIMKPLIADGTIGINSRFDDRKFRFDGALINGNTLEIALGDSYYKAFQQDQEREDRANLDLQWAGMSLFDDRWAYLQRNPGTAGIVISATGCAYLGARTNPDQTGKLNSVAGHMDYRENIQEVDILAMLASELDEEMGIAKDDVVGMRFVGAYGHPIKGDLDFTWIVRTNLGDNYFAHGGAWETRRKKQEHGELVRLANPVQVKFLLDEGRVLDKQQQFNIMYSTRGGLESLTDGDFRAM